GMSALLDSLASGFDGDAARREALDAALRDGLPLVRSEAWKYTPLRALDRRSFIPATAAAFDTALLEGIPAPRMVFVNGRYEATHSDLSGLPPTVKLLTLAEALADPDSRASNFMQRRYARVDEVFARLNSALAQDGAVLRMAEDTRLAQPLHLVFIGTAPGDAHAARPAR